MNGTRVARRAALLGQRRLVLFEDRVEEHFLSVFGLEVRRLFFDELECATVRPQRQALEIVLAALAVSLSLLTAGVSLAASQRPVAAAGFLLALVFGAILLLVLLWPPWQLVIRAGGEELRSLLPRRAGARQQALAAAWAMTGGLLLVVEPGTAAAFAVVRAARPRSGRRASSRTRRWRASRRARRSGAA